FSPTSFAITLSGLSSRNVWSVRRGDVFIVPCTRCMSRQIARGVGEEKKRTNNTTCSVYICICTHIYIIYICKLAGGVFMTRKHVHTHTHTHTRGRRREARGPSRLPR
ncbi:unnamed protein product, partial [Ixodes pacificus]